MGGHEVICVMKKQPQKWYTLKDITAALPYSYISVRSCCTRLHRAGMVECRIDPTFEKSGRPGRPMLQFRLKVLSRKTDI